MKQKFEKGLIVRFEEDPNNKYVVVKINQHTLDIKNIETEQYVSGVFEKEISYQEEKGVYGNWFIKEQEDEKVVLKNILTNENNWLIKNGNSWRITNGIDEKDFVVFSKIIDKLKCGQALK